MRFAATVVATALILISSVAFAENINDLKKTIVLDQKKLVVLESLPLSEAEAEKFWPVFRDLQEDLYNQDRKHLELISFYLKKYKDKSLTDEEAASMIEAHFGLVDERRKRLKAFVSGLEMEKVLPVKKVFRYLQIQQNLDAADQFEIAQKVPLLD